MRKRWRQNGSLAYSGQHNRPNYCSILHIFLSVFVFSFCSGCAKFTLVHSSPDRLELIEQRVVDVTGEDTIVQVSLSGDIVDYTLHNRKMNPSQLQHVVNKLISDLKDSNDVIRTHAATSLGKLSVVPEQAMLPLAHALKHDKSKWVRRAAARALGNIESRAVVPHLKAALSDRNKWVVHSAKRALERRSR